MRTPRFYLPAPLEPGRLIELDERTHRHAVQVLRLKPGEALVLFNGEGGEYRCKLAEVERASSSADVIEYAEVDRESPLDVTLVQGIAKGDHMDYSLQKAVELGVNRIRPVFSDRSVVRLEAKRLENKRRHWEGVIVGASEQSGRTRVPELLAPMTLSTWLEQQAGSAAGFVLDPTADQVFATTPRPQSTIHVVIGPEGGLTEQEVERAAAAGLTRIRLGPRVLRTETAAAATLTALQLLWGDLGE